MNPNGEILDRPVFLQYLFEVYNANIEKTINDLPPLDEQRFEKLKKLQDKDIEGTLGGSGACHTRAPINYFDFSL